MTLHPYLVLVLSLIALWLSCQAGAAIRRKQDSQDTPLREDLGVILAATLTLLGLVIGFTFSMALSRYDQRKDYEEAEANAIGTAWMRTDLLPAADGAKVRAQLAGYLEQRVLFYVTRDAAELAAIDVRTQRLQKDLWASVLPAAAANPSAITALVVAGMNDVLNSQGYTQGAWANRIPQPAWALMFVIAIFSNALVGYGSRSGRRSAKRFWVLPAVLSIAFMLISDIDSPRRGLIDVEPENLTGLAATIGPGKSR
jgi:hypothetical protein